MNKNTCEFENTDSELRVSVKGSTLILTLVAKLGRRVETKAIDLDALFQHGLATELRAVPAYPYSLLDREIL